MMVIEGLSKAYGDKRAVDNVSFTVPQGAVTAFVGPNGAGKSTVMNIIAGLIQPDSGSVLVEGQPYAGAPRPGDVLGTFLSAEAIPPLMSAKSFLTGVCELQGIPRSRVAEVLELVDLAHTKNRRIKSFSLGMRQRLGIAAALMTQPRILMMDEPANGLDPEGVQWFRRFIQGAAASGTTILLSSHLMAELAMVADYVVVINSGCIVAQGTVGEVTAADHGARIYLESPDLELAQAALEARGFAVCAHGDGLAVQSASALDVGHIGVTSGAGITHLSTLSRSLEETYFDLVRTTPEMSQS